MSLQFGLLYNTMADKIWELFLELRKELIESQKIRAQVIGFKITFVTASVGLIATKIQDLDSILFVIPAFASFFFDFLIYSYSFSIKRIGSYVRDYVEPALTKHGHMPADFVQWQNYLTQPKTKQNLALYGNFGVTLIVVLLASASTFIPFRAWLSFPILILLLLFSILDVLAYRSPLSLGKLWKAKDIDRTNDT